MRPTPDQIERARLVSLWRRRFVPDAGTTWIDYDPHVMMRYLNDEEWPEAEEPQRPDILEANGHERPNRIISNRPARPDVPTPNLELPNDFPY